ncbi:2-dehydro-3-deoxygluconokinase [Microbacterium sp. W4I4]|uniref:sugar kinase n=1 Tax=Microbacterium sp. W4I4 TaxID=3042295 RepID=UPI00278A7638|nr:sugar kinase [Microbacterium sp. W4I4]MDQ0614902.1 2-dehydro-3-deoxygluconokinase [Microbacterium sp. W4I4]
MSLDVLAIGESLGLLVPQRAGRLSHVRDLRLGFGGAESNVAIGVSRLGARAGWCGRVGSDDIGDMILREIRAEGVGVWAVRDDSAPTALMIKERPRAGATRIVYYREAAAGRRLVGADIPEGLIESTRILHITGISAGLGAGTLGAVHAAIDRAHAAGVLVSFDVNHRSALWRAGSDPGAAYRGLAERADIVFAGEDEAELTTGERGVDGQLEALLSLGAACAVIKRGADGAVAAVRDDAGERRVEASAITVDVVDTVGAGDAFVSGWLAETVAGAELDQRMATAVACGAFACTVEGDWEAAPSHADLRAFSDPDPEPVRR